MKRAIIVHGWDFNPSMNWYPWLKKELEERGYEVIVPEMPNTEEPKINSWISHLKKVIKNLDRDTLLIGHSIGCQTVMRYLEKESFNDKLKVIFIAGWFKLDNLEGSEVEKIAKPWLETPIDFNKVKSKISSLTVFLSDNEPYNYIDYNSKLFKEKLGAKTIILKNKGHFTEEDGIKHIPEILELIK